MKWCGEVVWRFEKIFEGSREENREKNSLWD
jgi:hypothetical protein